MRRLFLRCYSVCAMLLFTITAQAQTFFPTHSLSSPVPFPANSYVDATIHVPQNLLITSLKVRVTIQYNNSELGWLSVGMQIPDGLGFVLNDAGPGPNYTNTVFMDDAAQFCYQSAAPHTGFFKAMNPLSSTYGRMSGGNWNLHIENYSNITNGSIVAFELELNNDILPVEMTTFSATAGNNFVNLRWHTESEFNSSHFNIYRSSSESDLGELWCRVDGHGNSSTANDYHITDDHVFNGSTYYYRIADVSMSGDEHMNHFVVSASPSPQALGALPIKYRLEQNFPNPFNPTTSIIYGIHKPGQVKLIVFNELGQEVAKLVDAMLSPNTYRVEFDATSLPSGNYYYSLSTTEFTTTKKMVLIK